LGTIRLPLNPCGNRWQESSQNNVAGDYISGSLWLGKIIHAPFHCSVLRIREGLHIQQLQEKT
jgi:hypothetical protein